MNLQKTKRLLLVAFHYPPIQGSTGVTRSLAFSKYLAEFGWDVTVLTATTSAYQEIRQENLKSIPPQVRVARALALDARKHLAIANKYPLTLAIPDRWQSWIPFGLIRAAALMLTNKPDIVMSTYPIASAHSLALSIHKLFGIPWLADFRDPMAQEGYPPEPRVHKAFTAIEQATFRHAKRVTVTTAGTASLYATRFPSYPRNSLITISNGYDDDMFADTTRASMTSSHSTKDQTLILLHSGVVYPKERDPTYFFQAVSTLKHSGKISAASVRFHFRAAGNEAEYEKATKALNIDDCIKFLPSIPYKDAIDEMRNADGFLLLQASNCNQQIPAKVYEYLAIGKPILGLTDRLGDTGQLLSSLQIDSIAALDSSSAIGDEILKFIEALKNQTAYVPPKDTVQLFSRRNQTQLLARTLDSILEENAKSGTG